MGKSYRRPPGFLQLALVSSRACWQQMEPPQERLYINMSFNLNTPSPYLLNVPSTDPIYPLAYFCYIPVRLLFAGQESSGGCRDDVLQIRPLPAQHFPTRPDRRRDHDAHDQLSARTYPHSPQQYQRCATRRREQGGWHRTAQLNNLWRLTIHNGSTQNGI